MKKLPTITDINETLDKYFEEVASLPEKSRSYYLMYYTEQGSYIGCGEMIATEEECRAEREKELKAGRFVKGPFVEIYR